MTHPSKSDRLEETVVLGASDLSERLLFQLATLPPDGDLEDGLWALVSTFADGSEDLAVGLCVPQGLSDQLVIRHAPRPSRPRVMDAARLFPEATHEEVFPIPHDEGSTLHIGTDDPMDVLLRRNAEQVALAVSAALRRHRLVTSLKREVQEVEQLRSQAVQSDKLAGLGRMAASIVHELNNPLTSIVAYADYLRRRWEQQGAEPSDRERLGRISEAAGRVLTFTRDLVAYSRPSSADPSAMNIHDVIERALLFCEHVIAGTNVTLVRTYGDLPPVRGLHGPLTQVFVNLVTNACQAMEQDGGKLTIETAYDADRRVVAISVLDEGHGIQSDKIDRLFEPYFTTRGDGGGNGLGLNIVQTIVASHGGTVVATHNEPKGARFVVELPTGR
ncbi:MAG: GHKL domain-containing protein [Polyangiaceae bacterium]|nr:GHKL domain-containing protein [Polyangiaceae bacterium]MBK8937795.1 GHKL domain-containing protein [Polyangiaceae bacterium]